MRDEKMGATYVGELWPNQPPLETPEKIRMAITSDGDVLITHPDRNPLYVLVHQGSQIFEVLPGEWPALDPSRGPHGPHLPPKASSG